MKLLEALKALVDDIGWLISDSKGVAGYHLNGDVAKWDDLLQGGRFECLGSLQEAYELICEVGKDL